MRDAQGDAETVRAFFALELDAAARASCADPVERLRRQAGGDDVRWVSAREPARDAALPRERRHGPDRRAGRVACPRVSGPGIEPFSLRLGGVRPFPSARRARVVVREVVAEPHAGLGELAAAVEGGVRAAGFPSEDRAFRPHLTLGRVRRKARFPSVTVPDTPLSDPVPVTEIVLFRSELHPSGSRHYQV